MDMFNRFLINHLSTESLQKTAEDNLVATPEGDEVIRVKLGDDENEITTNMHQLDSLIAGLRTNESLSVEGGHNPKSIIQVFGQTITSDDNYVVNGVFLPDYIANEDAEIRVEVIRRTKKMKDMGKDTVYYILDDYDSGDIVQALTEEGFIAADSPIELSKAIERLRHRRRQTGH